MLLNISKHATINYTYIKQLNKADKNSTLLINELIKPVEKNGCFSSLEHFLLALYVTTPKKLLDVLFLIFVLTNSESVYLKHVYDLCS